MNYFVPLKNKVIASFLAIRLVVQKEGITTVVRPKLFMANLSDVLKGKQLAKIYLEVD
jgi:hypothetical protein